MDAQGVHWGSPALADEIELCYELVSPSGHDRLPRRVARRMVVVSALGAALRVAAIPHAHVHGVDGRLVFGPSQRDFPSEQVAQGLGVYGPVRQSGV
jgi:hypothetical protein